jgi:hypothetical protein
MEDNTMKKTYQQPATRVVTIQQRHQLLSGSLSSAPNNVGINNTVSTKASYARSFRGDWDNWEDE